MAVAEINFYFDEGIQQIEVDNTYPMVDPIVYNTSPSTINGIKNYYVRITCKNGYEVDTVTNAVKIDDNVYQYQYSAGQSYAKFTSKVGGKV